MAAADSAVFHHTCFVVRDIEKTATQMARSLGVTFALWTIETTSGQVRGKDATVTFRIAIAQVGDASFELLAPVSSDNVYTEHLAKHGEGFHHTCLGYSKLEDLHAARDALLAQGYAVVQNGEVGDLAEFYYFDMPELNSVLELLYLGELPPPEMTIG